MEKIPDIVMQCPKCRKEFPVDANYCEDCTAMLEPAEREQTGPPQTDAWPMAVPGSTSEAGAEEMEDLKIDSLKTDIEESFISTLLLELIGLKKRIGKKETALAELQDQQTTVGSPDHIRMLARAESEVNELLKRTAKIEAILENLRKKLEADIEKLHAVINRTDKPGLSAYFSDAGRYSRILCRDLKTKKALLSAIEAGTYSKKSQRLKYAFSALLLLIVAGALTWSLTPAFRKSGVPAFPEASDKRAVNRSIQPKEIYDLLEDIRKANMNKDLGLWESRYARQYLEAGKKRDETAEKWRKFDYLALDYKVQDIRMLPGGMTAVIAWDMELRSMESGRITRTVQKLVSSFIVEDDRLRIASVGKAAQ